MPMQVTYDIYRHGLISRGWLREDADRMPVKWSCAPGSIRTTKDRQLFAQIRALAMRSWDACGIDLLEQIIRHIEASRLGTVVNLNGAPVTPADECLVRVRAVVNARNTLQHLVNAKFTHFAEFVYDLDEIINVAVGLVRSELVRRLLSGEIAGPLATEAIAALQEDPESIDALMRGIAEMKAEDAEPPETRGFGT